MIEYYWRRKDDQPREKPLTWMTSSSISPLPEDHREEWLSGSSMGEIHNNGWGVQTKTFIKATFICRCSKNPRILRTVLDNLGFQLLINEELLFLFGFVVTGAANFVCLHHCCLLSITGFKTFIYKL